MNLNQTNNFVRNSHSSAKLNSKELFYLQGIADVTTDISKLICNSAFPTTDHIFKTIGDAGQQLENFAETSSQQGQQLLEKATIESGRYIEDLAQNPVLKFISNLWGAGWLKTLLGDIDRDKMQEKVKSLQGEYSLETSNQIAHRVMVNKAWEAGKIGLTTNIIPPIAIAMLGIELAATTRLQAEMIYEIAAAYGLDLHEPARRGEVLAIFGLSVGGNTLKTGLSLVEILPIIGPVVAASTNAITIYVLGLIAGNFYEAKLNQK